MKKYTTKKGNNLEIGSKVFYKRAQFEISKMYRDRLGVVILELETSERDPFKDLPPVIAKAEEVQMEYKNKYDKRGVN
jgi:hypothetical protein